MWGSARVCLIVAAGLAAACGGSEEGGLFSKGSGGSSSGGTSSGGASSGGASGAGGAAAGTGGAPTGGSAGASGAGGATSDGGGSGGTAAADGGGASGGTGGGAGGSGGASATGTGPCGAEMCAFSAGDACCKTSSAPLHCTNEKLSNPCECSGIACDTLEIKCDGPEDCAGKVCCAERGLVSSSWDVVECRETCKSDQPVGSTRREVCHPGGKPCANGTACTTDPSLPPGYGVCGP